MVAYDVAIVGAGVVGLNTAIALQHEFGDGVKITMIADRFQSETTSDGAAGVFLPAAYFSGPDEDTTVQWIRESYSFYDRLKCSPEGRNAGVCDISGYMFSKLKPIRNPFMPSVSEVYRSATTEELCSIGRPGKAKYGVYLTTLTIECRYFLPWAEARLRDSGVNIQAAKVTSWSELAECFDVVFNCMGLGAKEMCHDRSLVPIRGQVFKVRAPWQKQFIYGDHSTYIIPNRDVVTLGGSRSYDNYNLEVNPHESADIWERCCSLVPRMAQAEVLREWVGLRPHRDPVRVEMELKNIPNHGTLKIIHNYGHGGYGVSTAPGTARHAARLLRDLHRCSGSHL